MKTLAMELGPFGVCANSICPGAVDGPRIEAVLAREAALNPSHHITEVPTLHDPPRISVPRAGTG